MSLFNLRSEHQTWSNKQSHHDLLYGSVILLISLNLSRYQPTASWEQDEYKFARKISTLFPGYFLTFSGVTIIKGFFFYSLQYAACSL